MVVGVGIAWNRVALDSKAGRHGFPLGSCQVRTGLCGRRLVRQICCQIAVRRRSRRSRGQGKETVRALQVVQAAAVVYTTLHGVRKRYRYALSKVGT